MASCLLASVACRCLSSPPIIVSSRCCVIHLNPLTHRERFTSYDRSLVLRAVYWSVVGHRNEDRGAGSHTACLWIADGKGNRGTRRIMPQYWDNGLSQLNDEVSPPKASPGIMGAARKVSLMQLQTLIRDTAGCLPMLGFQTGNDNWCAVAGVRL